MGLHIHFDRNHARQKLLNHWQSHVLPPLSEKLLNDCNQYCKVDSGALQASGHVSLQQLSGQVSWSAAYAHRQYHELPNASRSVNPGAQWRWAHHAASAHQAEWRALAQKLFTG